ncbi:MAG: hypothetical protein IPH12_14470 [Saprospirales bacterium]|nr:hypothetical protein [Saprospirales bacterium]
MTQDRKGAVFVGTLRGGGLVMYRSFEDFRQGRTAQRLLPGLSVSYIFIDREGGYWIGTQERGLFYCASFDQGRPEAPAALHDGIVKSLDWDRRNTLLPARTRPVCSLSTCAWAASATFRRRP